MAYSVLFCAGSVVNRSKQASCPAMTRVGSFRTRYLSSGFPWTCEHAVGKLPVGLYRVLASRVEFLVAALSTCGILAIFDASVPL